MAATATLSITVSANLEAGVIIMLMRCVAIYGAAPTCQSCSASVPTLEFAHGAAPTVQHPVGVL
jgi:hypothetical protein